MARVFVSIGSNIEREKHIRGALDSLRNRYGELVISTVYETRAVGFNGDNFFNLVAAFETDELPQEVTRNLRAIEDQHGRERQGPPFAARTLDIDMLLYDDLVVDEPNVKIPRNEITRYAFVLKPLTDIAGDLKHPVTGKTYRELWEAFDDHEQALWPVELTQ